MFHVSFVSLPADPTSQSTANVTLRVTNAYLMVSSAVLVDGALLPNVILTEGVVWFVVDSLSAGQHQLSVETLDTSNNNITLSHHWTVSLNFIDLLSASSNVNTGVAGIGMLKASDAGLLLDESPSNVTLTFDVPLLPGAGEIVLLSCFSNDTSAAVVVGVNTFTITNQNFAAWRAKPPSIVVAGVRDAVNNEPLYQPFTVTCAVSSVGGGAASVYASSSVRRVSGVTQNIVWPYFQDVLVLDDFGRWTSSITASGQFALTVSKNVTALIVGDVTFLSRDGPHFLPDVSVRIGGLPVADLRVVPDVSAYLANVSSRWYDSRASMWRDKVIEGVLVVFPGYDSSCLSATTGADVCTSALSSYRAIEVSNSDGGALSCPPACPGASDASLTAGLGWSSGGGGVFYTKECVVGFLNGSACFVAETAHQCAYGKGDSCRPCPAGGMCPGGYRVW